MMKYIIGNWKMNLSLKDITAWIENFTLDLTSIAGEKQVLIAPTFPYLSLLSELTQNKAGLQLAAQDVSTLEKGAHTGEVGAFQLKDFCSYCIVGHSERKEPQDVVIKKRDKCLAQKITPIVCFVEPQMASTMYVPGSLLAWEDPTNISVNGVYKPKDPAEIEKGINQIRELIPADAILIYGGSVNRDNIQDLAKIKGINGILPGNASTDPIHFADLISKF